MKKVELKENGQDKKTKLDFTPNQKDKIQYDFHIDEDDKKCTFAIYIENKSLEVYTLEFDSKLLE